MTPSKKQNIQRSVIFAACWLAIVFLCLFHGLKSGERTIHHIDQMIDNGTLTAKFWEVIQSRNGQITVTKYQHTITLGCPLPADARVGDKVSFTARLENAKGHPSTLWHPTAIHFHGTSTFKYVTSLFSVFLVLIMGLKYLSLDRKSFSLTFKER
jgi:hypothetical protein